MKKKYTKKQIQEAIKYWEKQLKAGNYKKLNESDEPKMATGADINKLLNDSNLKSEVTDFIEKQSWLNALVFAYLVVHAAQDQYMFLSKRDDKNKGVENASKKFYNACEDIKSGMFAAANDGKALPMEPMK